jgi:PIN domain nuclease of toxin-antitoxin system
MKVLIDSNALYWWWTSLGKLTDAARRSVNADSNDLYVSSATAWELSTKHRLGKLPGAEAFLPEFADLLNDSRVTPLSVTVVHALEAGRLPGIHRDPFDRILIAQALIEDMAVVSSDRVFRDYGVRVIW